MRLDVLISGLSIKAEAGGAPSAGVVDPASVRVCDLTEDSRTVLPGSLFIARRGEKADGRAFVPAAVSAGAVAVLTDDPALAVPAGVVRLVCEDAAHASALLAERFYGDPTSTLGVVGVTGTNGKTTTTFLIHQLLNGAGVRCGLVGTVCIDDGSEVAEAQLTTPPAMELSRTFARMLECGCRAAAIEASSHALDQSRVAAVKFRVGVFTNLTQDHLDYHGTMEAYAAAKARLFEMLPPEGVAVVNGQDPWTARMLRDCRARVVSCAVRDRGEPERGDRSFQGASVRAEIVSMGPWGMELNVESPWGAGALRLPLPGRHNAMNALQAAAAAHALGLEGDAIMRGLAGVAAPPGRLEPVSGADHPLAVYVDYAHTDDALERALAACRALLEPGGRLWCVFGCGGDRDQGKRPKMGLVAARDSDEVIVTSDNPRTEQPGSIIDMILAGVRSADRAKVRVHADREAAIHAAVAAAGPGDIVLIAGKGHETYQITPDGAGGTRTRHFDDREVARVALSARFPQIRVRAAAGLLKLRSARA
jgi:UDP-N-acetylmuramoyl-L-alanyl-D-glutamate--2,6-diaminopimelate ligase